jgi:hypothetical protein
MDRRARRDESRECDRGMEKISSDFVSHIRLVFELLLVIDVSRNASDHDHEHDHDYEDSKAIAQCRDTRQLFPLEQFQ